MRRESQVMDPQQIFVHHVNTGSAWWCTLSDADRRFRASIFMSPITRACTLILEVLTLYREQPLKPRATPETQKSHTCSVHFLRKN